MRLPGQWMIWGSDIQLDTEIDAVQLAHFRRLAKENSKHRILLCTAKPAWIREMHRDADSYKNYWFFLDQIRKQGGTVDVSIAGDLHHYMRYASRSGQNQKITAGGGGSYLRGTHDIPESVAPPDPEKVDFYSANGETETYRESGFAFPSRRESRRLALGALKFPLLRRSWAFCLFLGVVYLMLTWTLGLLDPTPARSVFQEAIATAQALGPGLQGVADYGGRMIAAAVTRPSAAALPFLVVLLFGAFCVVANPRSRKRLTWLWGLPHGALHVSLALLIAHLVASLAASRFGPNVTTWAPWEMLAVYATIVALGAVGSGTLMGVYLVLSDWLFTLHTNEAFSAQALPDYRCFLRMRVKQNGELTIYPIGIRWAPRNWRRKLDRVKGEALFTPHGDMPRLHLIEGPITVPDHPVAF